MTQRRNRKRTRNRSATSEKSRPPAKGRIWKTGLAVAGIGSAVIAGLVMFPPSKKTVAPEKFIPRPRGSLTFNHDIAPILFHNCAPCHRPGRSAPFNLLTYADARKHAKAIAEVTARRYMPPWLPEHGYGDFADERRLSTDQIGMLHQWFTEGAPEGKAVDLPPTPTWPEGWELGKPDLVITLPTPYQLPPDGRDVYRNFVVPIPGVERHFVRAVEFHPGNNQVVHHAFIETDSTRQSRHFVDKGTPPGFNGMELPDSVQMPGGQMLGWQPGKPPLLSPKGLSWILEPHSDLVLQIHMHPSGKPEMVDPAVGLYFTDEPPTNTAFRLNLIRYHIDIPPGAKDYAIENRYVLPVDVSLLRINPHTHYLGKELQGYAILPDGTKKWLLLIKNWDFNWQGDYRYVEPVFLPKGTTLVMHFIYDNSAGNIHNPNQPPKRVKFGLQTTDEMGELWFQLLPRNAADREILSRDFFLKFTRDAVEENGDLVRQDPADDAAQTRLAVALLVLGRTAEAINHLQTAIRLRPDNDEAHSALGGIYLRQNRLEEARAEFEAVLRSKPDDYQSFGSLGYIFMQQGNPERAEVNFENALRLNPDDPIARGNLERLRAARRTRN